MKKLILSILFISFGLLSFGQNLKGYNVEALLKLEAKRAFVIDLDTFYATTQLSGIDTILVTKNYLNSYQKYSDTLITDATKYDLTFKQNVLSNPVTGTGTANYISKWTGTTTQGNSQIFDNGTNVGIGTTIPINKLTVEETNAGNETIPFGIRNLSAVDNTAVSMAFYSINSAVITGKITNKRIASGDYSMYLGAYNNFQTLTLRTSGNVGIGTTTPSEKLEANGNIKSLTGKFTNLTDNFLPYHVSDASGLANSNVFQTSSRLRYNTTLTTFDNDNDIPNVKWVNSVATGNMPKLPVDAATTTNITLSGTQTIDGYSVTAGMRVLVKNQTTESQNGVYVVAAGAWSRSTDLDTWDELYKAYVAVLNGTTNSGAAYVCTIPVSGTLGTDAITWILYNAPSNILVNSPLSKSGNTISLNYDTNTLDLASGNLKVKDNIFQPLSSILTNTTATYLDADSIKLAKLESNFIQNQNDSDQTANIWISGKIYSGDSAPSGEINQMYIKAPQGTTSSATRAANFENHYAGTYAATGIQSSHYYEGANNQAHGYATQNWTYSDGTGRIGEMAGLMTAHNNNSGTVTNYYGLKINTPTVSGGTILNRYGIYSAGGMTSFISKLMVGSNAPSVSSQNFYFKNQSPYSDGIYGITSTQAGIFSNSTATIGHGGVLNLGGIFPNSGSEYTAAFIKGSPANSTNYKGQLDIYTTSGGGGGETNSANYKRLSINQDSAVFKQQINAPTGQFTNVGSATVSNILGLTSTGLLSKNVIIDTTDIAGLETFVNNKIPTFTQVYPGAGIPISTGSAWGTSIANNSTNWNTAYTDRNKWDGGATGLNSATGRTSLGGTTIGQNLFTSTNPAAIRFLRANADNSVSWLTASDFRTAIGAGTSSATVSSVGLTVPTGLTVSGSPITSSGTLAVDLQSGYSIPTTANQTNWSTSFGWGDHASAGYLTSDVNYAKLNAANIFSQNQTVAKSSPLMLIKSTDATVRKLQFLNSSGASVGNIVSNTDGSIDINGSTDIEINAGSGNNFRITNTGHYAEGLDSIGQTNVLGYNKTTGLLSYFNNSSLYTAGTGLKLAGNAFGFDFNGMNLIGGASVVDGDFMSIYDTSIGNHYKLSMGGLKTYLNIPGPYVLPLATNSERGGIKTGYVATANNFQVMIEPSTEAAYVPVPNSTAITKGIQTLKAPLDATYLTTTSNGDLTSEIVVGATPSGDLGGTWSNISVDDDSHNHTGSTISGLSVADFTSPNISNWTNDANYTRSDWWTIFSVGVGTLDDEYNSTTWNGNIAVPTKNAIRDKIESLGTSPFTSASGYSYLTNTGDYINLGGTTNPSPFRLNVEGNMNATGTITTPTINIASSTVYTTQIAHPTVTTSNSRVYKATDNHLYYATNTGRHDLTGHTMPIKTISSATALTSEDYTILLNTGSSITSFPAIVGKIFILVNLTGAWIDTPEIMYSNSGSYFGVAPGYRHTIQYNGTNWYIISH